MLQGVTRVIHGCYTGGTQGAKPVPCRHIVQFTHIHELNMSVWSAVVPVPVLFLVLVLVLVETF